MFILIIILVLIAAYLIGSFPPAYVVGRFRKGVDIRQVGSRNMGAMNVFYQVGFAEGLLVLAIDIAKGAAAVALASFIGMPVLVQYLAAVVVVLGHNFPVFLKFRGGRGGATCIGILAFLMPWGIPAYVAVFGVILLLTRFPTLSYSIAFLVFPLIGWFVYHDWGLVIFTIGLLLIPLLGYTPRIKEMRARGGSWQHVIHRRGLRDRL